MAPMVCQKWFKKTCFFVKNSKFCVVWTTWFCSNFTSMWYKHSLRNVWRDFRLLMSALATVTGKSFNSKFTQTRRFSNHESRLLSRSHTFAIIVILDLKIHQSMWIHWPFFAKTWTKGHWPLDDLWPHVCWGHMCDSTQGSLCPSPMGIHQCMWIQWSILQITTYIHIHTYYIHTTYRMSDHIVSYWTQFRRDNYWTQFRRDKNWFSDRVFFVTIADTDIKSLKSLHTLFDKYLDHMLGQFEQNRMVRTI